MSILAFGDLHLGLKSSYSSQLESGFVSSEEEALKVLTHVYERSKADDISMIIFTGDLTHTNHPTSLVAGKIVDWLIQMDKLQKPVYLITGNHDRSTYSHSFDFITPLLQEGLLRNIIIVDEKPVSIKHNGRDVFFVPFIWGDELVNKYSSIESVIKSILSDHKSDLLIVSHFQESESVSGSESAMISKSTEVFNLDDDSEYNNVLFLLGHIHQYQQYTKRNGIDVCYTGNPYYHDRTDCNKPKGFVIIDDDFTVNFEAVPGITRFYKYLIPLDTDPESFFKSIRLFPNSVAYIENNIYGEQDILSDYSMAKILGEYKVILADVRNTIAEQIVPVDLIFGNDNNIKTIFMNTVKATYESEGEEKINAILTAGDELLAEAGFAI